MFIACMHDCGEHQRDFWSVHVCMCAYVSYVYMCACASFSMNVLVWSARIVYTHLVISQRGSTEQMSWNVTFLMQTMFDEHN